MAASQRSLDLDIVTLRRIYARDTNNYAITSNYALLADGKGGTYWGNVSIGGGNTNGTITSSNAFFSNATFSNASFSNATFSNATFSNATFNTLTANSITTTTLSFTNLQIKALNICNIYINDGSTNYTSYPNITSNTTTRTLEYSPSSNLMGLYFFIRSPMAFNFLPPQTKTGPGTGVTSNTQSVLTGNFFVIKNMGSNNNINTYTLLNPSDTQQYIPVIPATSATFFYTGSPQNIWTPM